MGVTLATAGDFEPLKATAGSVEELFHVSNGCGPAGAGTAETVGAKAGGSLSRAGIVTLGVPVGIGATVGTGVTVGIRAG